MIIAVVVIVVLGAVGIVLSSRALQTAHDGERRWPGARAFQIATIVIAALGLVWLGFSTIGNIAMSMQ